MSKITVTTIAGLTSGGDANTVKIESGDSLNVVSGDLTVDTNVLKVDSSNNKVGIGTNSPFSANQILNTGWSSGAPYGTVLTVTGNNTNDANWGHLLISDSTTSTGSGGSLRFAVGSTSSDLSPHSGIDGYTEGSNYGGLKFFTRPNGGTSTERARIDSSGNLLVGKQSANASGTDGFEYNTLGQLAVTRNNDTVALLNRRSNHGDILDFRIDNNLIGSIGSESGKLQVNSDGGSNLLLAVTGTTRVALDSVRLYPAADDNYDLGISNYRFDDIFATNGTIQTSDQNEKQDIANATTKELNVAKKLSTLFKTFRWKDKVTEKGDKARTHSGIIAQDIQSAFSAEGLDASNYGLFTSYTWWEKEISVDAIKADEEKGIKAKDAYTYMDTKEEKTDGYTERTRLGVRYPELFSFIFSSIESRLTALESK